MNALRDPKLLYERYGRQLLVDGADFAGQHDLHGLAAVFAADTSKVGQAAAQVCAHYLVGAGLGRAVAPSAWAAGLQELDPQLILSDNPRLAEPPVAQFWFAQRPYGASVDVALTDAAPAPTAPSVDATTSPTSDWTQGATGPARVATLRLVLGQPATADAAVVLGALAADLVVADVLKLAALPALVAVDWSDPNHPHIEKTERGPQQSSSGAAAAAPSLLAELKRDPQVLQIAWSESCARYPQEACGLVLRDAAGLLTVVAAPNVQDRYHALDPQAYPRTARTAYKLNERLIAKAAEQGQHLVAIWHSHCDAGAYFSAEDVRCAAPNDQPLYPDVAYLVVSVIGGAVAGAQMYHWDPVCRGFAHELQPN